MDVVGNGLVLILNGLLQMAGWLASWPVLMAVLISVCLAYLATLEVAEVDRSTAKPEVERH